jgi:hypothetical protein
VEAMQTSKSFAARSGLLEATQSIIERYPREVPNTRSESSKKVDLRQEAMNDGSRGGSITKVRRPSSTLDTGDTGHSSASSSGKQKKTKKRKIEVSGGHNLLI